MKLTMKKKPRAPQVGDLWRSAAGVSIYIARCIGDNELRVSANGQALESMGVDSLKAYCTLTSTGALTLVDREDLGIMPDITEDDRTPLGRMTAERDAAVADRDSWRAVANQMETQRHAEVAEVDRLKSGSRFWELYATDMSKRFDSSRVDMRGAYQRLQARMVEAEQRAEIIAFVRELSDCAEDDRLIRGILRTARTGQDYDDGRVLWVHPRNRRTQPKEPSADDALLQVRSALRGGV